MSSKNQQQASPRNSSKRAHSEGKVEGVVWGPYEWRVPVSIVKRGPYLMEKQFSAAVFIKVWACIESSKKVFVQTETSCLVSFEISRLHPHNFFQGIRK